MTDKDGDNCVSLRESIIKDNVERIARITERIAQKKEERDMISWDIKQLQKSIKIIKKRTN